LKLKIPLTYMFFVVWLATSIDVISSSTMTYRNTISNVVSTDQSARKGTSPVGPGCVSNGEGSKCIASECLAREVLRQCNVGHVGEGTTEGVSGSFQSVIRIFGNERLDLSNDLVVYGGPGPIETSHDLHIAREVNTRELGSDKTGVNVIQDVGD
jgi:hypothetical protein